MKRYRFRLESVLRVRRVQEDVARVELARTTAVVVAAEANLVGARHWLQRLASDGAPSAPAAWEAHRQIVLSAAVEVDDRVADVAAATAQRRVSQTALGAARTRVRALERLDERRRAEHDLDAGREAERVVDDLVTSRFVPRTATP